MLSVTRANWVPTAETSVRAAVAAGTGIIAVQSSSFATASAGKIVSIASSFASVKIGRTLSRANLIFVKVSEI